MAHKSKATADVAYNPEDPPLVYSNESVHSRLDGYTSMARAVHGPEYDLSAHDLDGEVVIRAGGGKKHGRFWIGDGTIDTASAPTLLDSSTEHEFQPGDTPTAGLYTVPDDALQVISVLFIVY